MSTKKPNKPIEQFLSFLAKYLKQETVAPLKALAGWAFLGFLGSILLAVGAGYFLVGSIRVLQNETGSTFEGNLNWLPYLISLAGIMIFGFLGFKLVKSRTKEK